MMAVTPLGNDTVVRGLSETDNCQLQVIISRYFVIADVTSRTSPVPQIGNFTMTDRRHKSGRDSWVGEAGGWSAGDDLRYHWCDTWRSEPTDRPSERCYGVYCSALSITLRTYNLLSRAFAHWLTVHNDYTKQTTQRSSICPFVFCLKVVCCWLNIIFNYKLQTVRSNAVFCSTVDR